MGLRIVYPNNKNESTHASVVVTNVCPQHPRGAVWISTTKECFVIDMLCSAGRIECKWPPLFSDASGNTCVSGSALCRSTR